MSAIQYEDFDMESEAFFESLAEAAQTGRPHRQLSRLAMRAARAALVEGMKACGGEQFDGECEDESWEVSPHALVHQSYSMQEALPALAMMEHLGHGAAEAESDGEAFAFLAPLLPLAAKAIPFLAKGAAKLLPKIASNVMKVAPKLLKGMKGAAKVLRSNPVTKDLVNALPQVVKKTTADIARQVGSGRPVSSQAAVRAFARNTAKVLGNPASAVRTVQRSKKVDRRVHQALNTAVNPQAQQQALGALEPAPGCTCQ